MTKKWYLYTTGETEEHYYWTHSTWGEDEFRVKTVNKVNGKSKIYRAYSHEEWCKLIDTLSDPRYITKDDQIFRLRGEVNHWKGLFTHFSHKD